MIMTTTELIESINKKTGLTKEVVAKVMESYKEEVLKALKTGEPVVHQGFGAFYLARLKKRNVFGTIAPVRHKIRFRISRRFEHE